jgi:hypothetical protein
MKESYKINYRYSKIGIDWWIVVKQKCAKLIFSSGGPPQPCLLGEGNVLSVEVKGGHSARSETNVKVNEVILQWSATEAKNFSRRDHSIECLPTEGIGRSFLQASKL